MILSACFIQAFEIKTPKTYLSVALVRAMLKVNC